MQMKFHPGTLQLPETNKSSKTYSANARCKHDWLSKAFSRLSDFKSRNLCTQTDKSIAG